MRDSNDVPHPDKRSSIYGLSVDKPRDQNSRCPDKDIAPARDRSERRGQTTGREENDKAHAEQTNGVDGDKQPERNPMEIFAQRFDTRDSYTKDCDRKHDGQAETGRAKSMF